MTRSFIFLAISLVCSANSYAMGKGQNRPAAPDAPLRCSIEREGRQIESLEIPRAELVNGFQKTFRFPLKACSVNPESGRFELADFEQMIEFIRYTGADEEGSQANQVERLMITYSDGEPGFKTDMSGPAMIDRYYPSISMSRLESTSAWAMTSSSFAPHLGPDLDVICVLGSAEDLQKTVEEFRQKPRFADNTASHNRNLGYCRKR